MSDYGSLEMFHVQVRSNLRELFLHDLAPTLEPDSLEPLRVVCKAKGIKTNLGPPTDVDSPR